LCGDKRLGSYRGSRWISNFDSGIKWGVEAGVFSSEGSNDERDVFPLKVGGEV